MTSEHPLVDVNQDVQIVSKNKHKSVIVGE